VIAQRSELPCRVPRSRTRDDRECAHVGVEGDLVGDGDSFCTVPPLTSAFANMSAYRHILLRAGNTFRIKERRVLIDAHELGSLGS